MAQRITDLDLIAAERNLRKALRDAGIDKPVTLYVGSSSYKITNKLLVGKMNLWGEGQAGYSKRECYNALRLMTKGLHLAIEAREDGAR